MELFGLTAADVATIKEMVAAFRSTPRNPSRAPEHTVEREETFAPEVYAALTPFAGLPGRTGGVFPGSAVCQIYRTIPTEADEPGRRELVEVPGLTRRVFNIHADGIPGTTFVIIERDKFGTWWVKGQASEEEGDGDTGTGTGTGTHVEHRCENTFTWTDYRPACKDGCLGFYPRTRRLIIGDDGCARLESDPEGTFQTLECVTDLIGCNEPGTGSQDSEELVFTDCCPNGIKQTLSAIISADPSLDCNEVIGTPTFTEGAIPEDEFNPAFDGWTWSMSWGACTQNFILYCNTSGDWVIRYGNCAGSSAASGFEHNIGPSDCTGGLLLSVNMSNFGGCCLCSDLAMTPAELIIAEP